ncbi:MAG TPA: signal peptide peptidase SppA [Mycobacteriales bacterium]|nr:signal peptide peptidase SppA [Mycobacteriales bacterium]
MVNLSRQSPPILLEIDLTSAPIDAEPDDPIAKLRSRGKPRLKAVLRTLHEAGDDDRVVGLVAKLGTSVFPLAIAQELRDGVRAFAKSGKPAVAWAETFGEFSTGTIPYYLATGFDEIWMQHSGELDLIGLSAEVNFLRGTLDKIGVEPQLDKRYEYKNAADRIMRKDFTPEHREAIDRLTESAWDGICAQIAQARGMSVEELRAIVDAAPLTINQAVERKLIDQRGYRDEVYADVRRRLGGDVRLLFAHRWSPRKPLPERAAALLPGRDRGVLALIEGHGAIVTGRNRNSPVDGRMMGCDSVTSAFRAARKDDKVRGVVFRVDSPGGSYVASDTIWREVGLTSTAGKPVVVSMGAVAGSGGYYVSIPADVIVAQPGTLTGSIGVFGGKAVIEGLLDKVGLHTGAVSRGARARLFSNRVGFTDDERARLAEWLDEVYSDFTGKVAESRGMSREAVHEVARGRVWTGADASNNGLVDVLGGMREATAIARERAGLAADAPLRPAIKVPPQRRLRAPRSSDDPRAASMSMTSGWGEFASIANWLGLPSGGPLMMPGVRLR